MKEDVYVTVKGTLAITQPEFKKIEAQVSGGFAAISQRTNLVVADLVMDYDLGSVRLVAGVDKVIIRGDAGLQPWAKQRMCLGAKEFVLCPENQVVGYLRRSG